MRETCILRNEGKAPGMGTEKQKTFSLFKSAKISMTLKQNLQYRFIDLKKYIFVVKIYNEEI